MVDDGHAGLNGGLRRVERRAAEERLEVPVRRKRRRRIEARRAAGKALRGIAAVGRAVVVEIFVAQPDLGVVVGLQRDGRIEAVALQMVEVAECVAALVEDVQARGDVFVDGLARIERDAAVAPGAGLSGCLISAYAVGFLERAVEKAAAGAAAEGQRARSFQHLDALGVVEIAEILNVVAEAVDEEIRAGVDAADHEFVAIAFALVDGDARHVAGDVGEALKALVADEILGDDTDRLRNVDDRRVALGRNRRAVGVIADRAGTGILRLRERLRLGGSRFGPPRRLRAAAARAAIGARCGRRIGAALGFGRGDRDRRQRRIAPLCACADCACAQASQSKNSGRDSWPREARASRSEAAWRFACDLFRHDAVPNNSSPYPKAMRRPLERSGRAASRRRVRENFCVNGGINWSGAFGKKRSVWNKSRKSTE